MTHDKAIDFLKGHQPMSRVASHDERIVRQLDEVRTYLIANPDVRTIPLLLNVFGEGDGLGVYQLVEDAIKCHPPDLVIPHIREALNSPYSSVRTWCAEIACSFPDDSYIQLLESMLEADDDDERDAARECLHIVTGVDMP